MTKASGNQITNILQRGRAARDSTDDGGGGEAAAKPAPKAAAKATPKPPEKSTAAKALGRPKTGKRSDPNYMQAAFWILNETSAQLDIELARAKRDLEELGDRSDLVERLISSWLKSRQSHRNPKE